MNCDLSRFRAELARIPDLTPEDAKNAIRAMDREIARIQKAQAATRHAAMPTKPRSLVTLLALDVL